MISALVIILLVAVTITFIVIMRMADSKEIADSGIVGLVIATIMIATTIIIIAPSSEVSIIKANLGSTALAQGLMECRYQMVGTTADKTTWMKPDDCVKLQKLKLEEYKLNQ